MKPSMFVLYIYTGRSSSSSTIYLWMRFQVQMHASQKVTLLLATYCYANFNNIMQTPGIHEGGDENRCEKIWSIDGIK